MIETALETLIWMFIVAFGSGIILTIFFILGWIKMEIQNKREENLEKNLDHNIKMPFFNSLDHLTLYFDSEEPTDDYCQFGETYHIEKIGIWRDDTQTIEELPKGIYQIKLRKVTNEHR